VAGHSFTPLRLLVALLACAGLALACFVVAVTFGELTLDWSRVLTAGTVDQTVFFSLRVPRVVLAAIVGAALAASGAMLQSLMRNPLADPFVLGVSGGAALGATVALALGLTSFTVLPGLSPASVLALAGALGATLLVLGLGRIARGDPRQHHAAGWRHLQRLCLSGHHLHQGPGRPRPPG
jgi:iron complex transport system permease protein